MSKRVSAEQSSYTNVARVQSFYCYTLISNINHWIQITNQKNVGEILLLCFTLILRFSHQNETRKLVCARRCVVIPNHDRLWNIIFFMLHSRSYILVRSGNNFSIHLGTTRITILKRRSYIRKVTTKSITKKY